MSESIHPSLAGANRSPRPTHRYTGIFLFGAGVIVGAITSTLVLATSSRYANGREVWMVGYVPVVGPVVAAAPQLSDPGDDAPTSAGSDAGYAVAMSIAGMLQTTGLIMAITGYGLPDTLVRDSALAPSLDFGPGSATATWTF